MTLFQHTLEALLRGEKTETSRICGLLSDGTGVRGSEAIRYPGGVKTLCRLSRTDSWTKVWAVGQGYAIQPGRGIAAVGRYRVLDIWQQDVRKLKPEQIAAEGFQKRADFMRIWTWMHDRDMYGIHWSGLKLDGRPNERYLAWRMSIEVLWDTVLWDAPAVMALQIPKRPVK